MISGIANALQFSAFFAARATTRRAASASSAACCSRSSRRSRASLVQLAILPLAEYVADATAARLTGDPEALATALERLAFAADRLPARVEPATASLYIVNPLTGSGLASLFSTHPADGGANRPPARAAERAAPVA